MFVLKKRGVSEVVAYVLLIAISFALAGMVYTWLKFYVNPQEEVKCDDGVAIALREYTYDCTNNSLNITLQNRGLFDIDGFVVRVNNRTGENLIGVYTINKTGIPLSTGQVLFDYYTNANITTSGQSITGFLRFIEVQPVQKKGNYTIFCDNVAKHDLTCSS